MKIIYSQYYSAGSPKKQDMPSILQEVSVPILENEVCQIMYKLARYPEKIKKSFLCAGYAKGYKDACLVSKLFIKIY